MSEDELREISELLISQAPDMTDVQHIKFMQLIKDYTSQAVLEGKIEELNMWHRWDGRDYDNETDEAIDERIEQLQELLHPLNKKGEE